MTFSADSALPEAYRSGAFVGEHGSWNRSFFNGYKVVYIPFENGKPAGKAQDVVTGFIDGDEAHGRPVGVGIDGTGALLVADDAGNTVWRVAAADGSVTDEPLGTDRAAMPPAPPAAAATPPAPPAAQEPAAPASTDQPATDGGPAQDNTPDTTTPDN